MASPSFARGYQQLRFDGRVAIVTGAGAGLGRSYALLLAARGASVVVNDLGVATNGEGSSSKAADVVVAEIRAAGGTAVADYNSAEDGSAIVATATKSFGKLDIMICNAGILRDSAFFKMDEKSWDLVYRVHLRGSFSCAHAAWKLMRDQGYGRILFVSSGSGLYGNFGQSNYSAAKMGILGLANTLAREGAPRGILVNTIAPIAASRMTENVLPPDLLKALSPDAVAPVAAYLVHDSCTTTGAVFELGAGWISRLRWQRSKGLFLPLPPKGDPRGDGIEPFSIEAVRDAWDVVSDFSESTFPDSTQSAFEPMLLNLQQAEESGSNSRAAPSSDDFVGSASAAALHSLSGGAPHPITLLASLSDFGLQTLPGGRTGYSAAVDVPLLLAQPLCSSEQKYGHREAALYALSVGACADGPTASSSNDLQLVYELHADGMRTLPTLAVLWQHTAMSDITSTPGLSFNPMMLLHGEQELILPFAPLPPEATVVTHARVSHVYDKGKGAVVVVDSVSVEKTSRAVLAVNRASIFIRGIGGFGGDRGPSVAPWSVPPGKRPDVSVKVVTTRSQALLYRLNGDLNPLHIDPSLPLQALLYRLNGDLNPLHIDPAMAAMGGFDAPILHGLCTFGISARILEAEALKSGGGLQRLLGSNNPRLRAIKARFTKHVFPGDTVVFEAWASPSTSIDSAAAILVLFRLWVVREAESARGGGVSFSDDRVVLAGGQAEFVPMTAGTNVRL